MFHATERELNGRPRPLTNNWRGRLAATAAQPHVVAAFAATAMNVCLNMTQADPVSVIAGMATIFSVGFGAMSEMIMRDQQRAFAQRYGENAYITTSAEPHTLRPEASPYVRATRRTQQMLVLTVLGAAGIFSLLPEIDARALIFGAASCVSTVVSPVLMMQSGIRREMNLAKGRWAVLCP